MKLTLHDARWDAAGSPWSDQALQAGARWIKIIDDPASAYAIALAFPKCNVIYRRVLPQDIEQLSDLRKHPEFNTPRGCAEMLVRWADIKPLPNLWIEGVNEPKLSNVDDAQWYGQVEALRSKLLAERGLRAVIGNFATGNPTGELFNAFMWAYKSSAGRDDVLIGIHEYGAINVPAAQDGHNLLRHRMLGFPGYRWAITECGLDRIQIGGQWVGGGWRKEGAAVSEEDYWRWLLDFNAELERDSDVVCACVFTYGDTARWADYEMNDAKGINANMINAIAADAAAVVKPARTYTRGIDISHWQTKVTSWAQARASGVRFAIINACDGVVKDALFDTHWSASKGHVLRGAYQFFYSYMDGAKQGAFFVSMMKGDWGEKPPVIDVEEMSVPAYLHAQRLKACIDTVEADCKKRPMIYTRANIWEKLAPYCAWAKDYPLWIAGYPYSGKAATLDELQTGKLDRPDLAPFGRWKIWQYTDSGEVPGIGKPVDLDVFDGDETALAIWAGTKIPEVVYTWQDFINATNRARKVLGYSDANWWSWLFVRAGIDADAIAKRTLPYDGPAIDALNWSRQEIAAYRAAGGKG